LTTLGVFIDSTGRDF